MDAIISLNRSTVQHGHHNDRVYLMKYGEKADATALIRQLEELAKQHDYGKIFGKIPASAWPAFRTAAYTVEARVPGLYLRRDDGIFIAKYLLAERGKDQMPGALKRLTSDTFPAKRKEKDRRTLHCGEVIICTPDDAIRMSKLYRQVFLTYPFPINDPAYIQGTMQQDVIYMGIREKGDIVALASTDIDSHNGYAEMTDFATGRAHRGRGYAEILLSRMEEMLVKRDIRTVFTIARASSLAMNRVFKKCSYTYSGFLKNNTQIAGGIESMTVWSKPLLPPS